MYIYIDESGIIEQGQSDYFIVSAYVVSTQDTAKRCLKDIRKNHLGKKYKELSEIKFHTSSDVMIKRILQCLAKHDPEIYYYAWKKKPFSKSSLEMKAEIFNTLLSMIPQTEQTDTKIIIDNFLKKTEQAVFTRYLEKTVNPIQINYANSLSSSGLQLADFISGTISRYYNQPENPECANHYNLIIDKIIQYK
ncbi:MAG TPA: DUF3800 domain-containing protein [Methanocorpusculum sp.]|nr:DUF3800 domain-containing protein [Methanocorpusculum sp.]